MKTAHKIEIRANNKQMTYFAKAAGTARFSYNWALKRWQELFQAGEKPSEASLRRELNSIKNVEFPWMAEVTKNAPQEAIRQLGVAFKNFFSKQSAYPTPRKKGVDDRFTLTNDQFKVEGNRIRIPHLGWVRLYEPLRFSGHILSATISRHGKRWFVSINVDADNVYDKKEKTWIPFPIKRESQAAVGIDLGITSFLTLSTGEEIQGPKPLKKALRKLRRLGKSLSRKEKGSKNRTKAKIKLAHAHLRVKNIRSDAIHKASHRIVQNYSIIGIEDLNTQGMMKNRRLSKAIADMGFGEFRRQITYKLARQGEIPYVADRWFPSSKLCSTPGCHHLLDKLPLHVRLWTCPHCEVTHLRDLNAAINLREMAASSAATACGASSGGGTEPKGFRPTSYGAMKQESSSQSNKSLKFG
jgi:putative transposase